MNVLPLRHAGFCTIACAMLALVGFDAGAPAALGQDAPLALNRKPLVVGFARQRVEEKMDRGLVALPAGEGRIYVGWRLLKEDPPSADFHVYRRISGQAPVRLTEAPLRKTTDFVDKQPVAGAPNEYFVTDVRDGREGEPSSSARATPAHKAQSYVTLPLQGDYTFQKCGVADLNGDGAYDYVIKQPNENIDP